MSESRTVCSLIAITPEVELRKPSLTVSPSTHVPDAAVAAAGVVVVRAAAGARQQREGCDDGDGPS